MGKDCSSIIDGYQALPRFERTCCIMCKHFDGVEKGSCAAYPDGIPDKYAVRNLFSWGEMHADVEEDQTGVFIFEIVGS